MKKVVLTLSAFALVAAMASCSKSPESAGEKVAKEICKCSEINKEAEKIDDEEKRKDKETEYLKCMADVTIMAANYQKDFYDDTAALRKFKKATEESSKDCIKDIDF